MDYLEENRRGCGRRLLVTVVVIAVIALLGFGLKQLLGDGGNQKQTVHNISLLKPPPPAAAPARETAGAKSRRRSQARPKPDAPTGRHRASSSASMRGRRGQRRFRPVGNKGGRDLLAGRGAFAFYTNLFSAIAGRTGENRKLKRLDYRVMVRVWLSKSGSVQRVDLGGSSGDAESTQPCARRWRRRRRCVRHRKTCRSRSASHHEPRRRLNPADLTNRKPLE